MQQKNILRSAACLLLLFVTFGGAGQTIQRNGVIDGSFSAPGDVEFTNNQPSVRLVNALVDANGTISFTNAATVILDKTTVKCRKIKFGTGVQTIQIRNGATIECEELEMVNSVKSIEVAGTAVINCNVLNVNGSGPITLKNNGRAEFTICSTQPFPATPKFAIEDAGKFKTVFCRK